MGNLVVILIIAIIGGIIFLSRSDSSEKSKANKRAAYLQKIAKFVDSKLIKIEGQENSFRINFKFKDTDFIYEDIEDYGFGDRVFFKGYLKAVTLLKFTLNFTERSRSSIRSEGSSLKDTVSLWGKNVSKVYLPKELGEFNAHTNNADWANKLIEKEEVVSVFVKYKNRDSRGYPMISLEIADGLVMLRFHATGDLKPSLYDIQGNASSIEGYLNQMMVIVERIHWIKSKEDN